MEMGVEMEMGRKMIRTRREEIVTNSSGFPTGEAPRSSNPPATLLINND